jgi:MFS family permease
MTQARLPTGIWMLGFVSLFMDVSSEMIHGLLPVFLTTVVGASALAVGLIEGAAESTASFMKLVSGAWSDRWGKRKPLAVLGYGLAALSKPLFPLADTVLTVLAARMADRVGKGIRGAPRDALIADLVAPPQRGAAFGLRQSLDTVGAFTGPLLAIGLMVVFANDIRAVFWVALIPALIAVAILVFGVHEPARATLAPELRPRFSRATLRRLPRAFWLLLLVTAPFTLARFSEAFLILRAQSAGLALALAPLTLVAMNVIYSLSAYPAGRLSDAMPRTRLLGYGCVVLIAANACLAAADTLPWAFAGTLLWGLHMGLTEGLITALIADHAPADLRGTGFGVLHFVRGVLLLVSSALAGLIWTVSGPVATFAAGAVLAAVTLAGLRWLPREVRR